MTKKDYFKIILAIVISICTIFTIFSFFDFVMATEIMSSLPKKDFFIPSCIFYTLLTITTISISIIDIFFSYDNNRRKIKIILVSISIILIICTIIFIRLCIKSFYEESTTIIDGVATHNYYIRSSNQNMVNTLYSVMYSLVINVVIILIVTIFSIFKKDLYNGKKDVTSE